MSQYVCHDCDATFDAPTDTDTACCPGCGEMVWQQPNLDAIEARANAATPGPWEFVTDDHGSDGVETSIWSEATHRYVAEIVGGMSPADGAFIAHAPEDVRVLLAEVRRLRAELGAARVKALATEADEIVLHCPDHGPQDQDGCWMDCHCAVADDIRRRIALPAAPAARSAAV